MNTIELFCGTKSFSEVMKKAGHNTWTTDNDDQFESDLCADAMELPDDLTNIMGKVDILWASPPCEGFSVASIGANWQGGHRGYEPKSETARRSIRLAKKTMSIIEATKPRYWFIENPRGMLRKMDFMNEFLKEMGGVRHTVWYCRYGDTRAKPTDIWTNASWWISRPACHNGNTDHEAAPRGSKTGTQGIAGYKNRSRIPAALFEEILEQMSKNKS